METFRRGNSQQAVKSIPLQGDEPAFPFSTRMFGFKVRPCHPKVNGSFQEVIQQKQHLGVNMSMYLFEHENILDMVNTNYFVSSMLCTVKKSLAKLP